MRHAHKDIQGDVEHLVCSLRSKLRHDQFRLCCHRAICPGQLVKQMVFRASAPQPGSCASVVSAVTLANDPHDCGGKGRILWRFARASEGDSANARNTFCASEGEAVPSWAAAVERRVVKQF